MTPQSSFRIADAFNECINRADIEGLTTLMTDDHSFVDKVGARVSGKAAVAAAWAAFFAAFPGYRNEFVRHCGAGDVLAIEGRSVCADPRLSGPALWRVKVRDGRVAEWQVYTDEPGDRRALGLQLMGT